MKRMIAALLLLVLLVSSLTGCNGVYSGIEPKPPVLTPQQKPSQGGSGEDPTEQEFTVKLILEEELFTETAGIQVQWANGTSVQRADFDDTDHIAKITGLDGDYAVTLHGLPDKYMYDANVHVATNNRRHLEIEIFEHIKPRQTGKGLYSPQIIETSRVGAYTVSVKKTGDTTYYQFNPSRSGMYIIETIADITANDVNPSIDVYYGHAAYKNYSHTVNSGGSEAEYTRNARYVVEVDRQNVGGAYTFGITATQKEGVYPVQVHFLIRYAGSYQNDAYYTESTVIAHDAAMLEKNGIISNPTGRLTYPEVRVAGGVYKFDGSMFALNPTDGFYHLVDENGEPNGPVLYAKLRRRHRFFADYYPPGSSVGYEIAFISYGEYGVMCVEDPGNKALQALEDGTENYRPFIEAYAAYVQNEEGVYPVTEELKVFLQKFSVSQRYFSDGSGWAETTAEAELGYRIYSSEEDQWLFACCYYS